MKSDALTKKIAAMSGGEHKVLSDASGLRASAGLFPVLLYGAAFALVCFLFYYCQVNGLDFSLFTKDPMALTDGGAFWGGLSNLGVVFWSATAGLCFLAVGVNSSPERRKRRNVFIFAALFTSVLLLDDLYMLHEQVLPEFFGVRQRYILLFYAAAGGAYLVNVYQQLATHEKSLLVLSFSLFALSIAEDALALATGSLHYLVEDGAKLFGIMTWFHLHYSLCLRECAHVNAAEKPGVN